MFRQRRPSSIAILWVFLLTACLRGEQDRPIDIRSASDVILKWNKDQHVYVKGSIGVGDQQLSQLESWLDENGPYWTVVLLQNAGDEAYESSDGRSHLGMNAVEYALGHGLSNRTSFGQLAHPQTGESVGAVLVIFLEERKLSYFASDAQDRRGLGESNWIGDLDRPAIRAMRSGGRIVDAVKDTVTTINSRLENVIEREQADKVRQALEREQALVELKSKIEAIQQEIESVEASSAAIREVHREADGELAMPPVEEWRKELKSVANQLTGEQVYKIAPKVNSVADRVSEFLNAYATAANLEDQVQALESRIESLSTAIDPGGESLQAISARYIRDARSWISDARKAYHEGRMDFAADLEQATASLESGRVAIEKEKERRVRAAARRRLVRNSALATSGLGIMALGGLGIVLNRRREPIMLEAQKLFAERKAVVASEVEKVFDLFEHSNEILGSRERLRQRGYVGRTQEISGKTFDNVDDLIVMSSEVERVMREAEELIHPRDPLTKIRNALSGANFQRAMERISGKPLEFKRDRGLPMAMGNAEGEGNSSNSKDPPPIVKLTFDEVFANFNERTEQAATLLDKLESSFLEVNDGLTELSEDIKQLHRLESRVSARATAGRYFGVPNFYHKLLPSIQADYDAGDAASMNDPVLAVENHIPTGERKVAEATRLSELLLRGHEELLPKLHEIAPKLEAVGYETEWIDDQLESLTNAAHEMFAEATEISITEKIQRFEAELTQFQKRAELTLELTGELNEELLPSVTTLEQHITAGRDQLAARLGLPHDQLLYEKPNGPDDSLSTARLQAQGIRAALHIGNTAAALEAVAALKHHVEVGSRIVNDSLRCERDFASSRNSRQERWNTARQRWETYGERIAEMKRTYSADSLQFDADSPADDAARCTVDDHHRECERRLDESARLLLRSTEFYQQGRVLEATAVLEAIEADLNRIDQKVREIDEHQDRLLARERQNLEQLEELSGKIGRLKHDVIDHRTSHSTAEAFRKVTQETQQVAHHVESQPAVRAPFDVAQQISSLTKSFDEVEARIASDRAAHAEARSAVQSAESQSIAARRLVVQARQDGIPDSRTTTQLVERISHSDQLLNRLKEALQVDHGDWKQLHEQAIGVHQELSLAAGQLVGELDLAGRAAAAVEQAARSVFQAAQWSGGWGIRTFGSPGSKELDRARAALESGSYTETLELSRAASLLATQAIHKAEREVARQQMEEQARLEAARRARQAASTNTWSGGGGFGGGFGGSGGGSGGYVSSGGGSSSSTSGFSRSGW